MVEHTKTQHNDNDDEITTDIDNQAVNEQSEIDLTDTEEMAEVKIKTLREKLARCEEERRHAVEDVQRHRAEFLNAKKRLENDTAIQVTRAKQAFIASIIPLCDSFTMAMSNQDTWEAVDTTWRKGVEGIYAQLQSVLTQYQVTAHTPEGEPFDPNRHEAVGEVAVINTDDQGVIQTVIQPGYTMSGEDNHEILVRPARVIVGTFGSKESELTAEDDD